MKKQRINYYLNLSVRALPHLNHRVAAWQRLREYADDPDIFISFTEIDKIGINPKSKYDTPIGIYTYPLKDIWRAYNIKEDDFRFTHDFNGLVPYAGESPFIQVVRNTSYKVLDTQKYRDQNIKWDMRQLADLFPDVNFERYLDEAKSEAKISEPIGYFWYVLWKLTGDLEAFDTAARTKAPVRWNKILRQLGYDVVVDRGKGIVHENEAYQGVFLTRQAFKHVASIPNKNPSNKINTSVTPNINPILRRELHKLKSPEYMRERLEKCWKQIPEGYKRKEYLYPMAEGADRLEYTFRSILIYYWEISNKRQEAILKKAANPNRTSHQAPAYSPLSFVLWLWCEANIPDELQNEKAFASYHDKYSSVVERALNPILDNHFDLLKEIYRKWALDEKMPGSGFQP